MSGVGAGDDAQSSSSEPLVPLVPLVPLEPLVPVVPLVPLVPLEPLVPLVPLAPLDPLLPLAELPESAESEPTADPPPPHAARKNAEDKAISKALNFGVIFLLVCWLENFIVILLLKLTTSNEKMKQN
jgi:hypothetical protein